MMKVLVSRGITDKLSGYLSQWPAIVLSHESSSRSRKQKIEPTFLRPLVASSRSGAVTRKKLTRRYDLPKIYELFSIVTVDTAPVTFDCIDRAKLELRWENSKELRGAFDVAFFIFYQNMTLCPYCPTI